ncbi:hypothetical protein JCM8097_006398 [Rhodosporidiobolus ruineniae]
MAQLRRHTYIYKRVRGVDVRADVYVPQEENLRKHGEKGAPVLVYYHGGGLCAGNRDFNDWVGKWLFYDALSAGVVVISFDYTLISPDPAFQVIGDVKDGMLWIRDELNGRLAEEEGRVRVDPTRIAVSGASGGGCLAYYAGLYSPVKLRAILAFYAEGGDFMLDWYVKPKTAPFLGIPLLDDLVPYEAIRDQPKSAPPAVRTELNDSTARGMFYYYLIQTGQAVDVFSGVEGVSKKLVEFPLRERDDAVPKKARPVIPHLNVSPSFPPTYLLHGVQDSIVHVDESRTMARVLREQGVEVKLWEVEGGEHGFDTDSWFGGPGGQDPELTRKRNEGLKGVVPWLLEHM